MNAAAFMTQGGFYWETREQQAWCQALRPKNKRVLSVNGGAEPAPFALLETGMARRSQGEA